MQTFLHAADLHVDSPLEGLDRTLAGDAERLRGATRRALENLVATALAERVAFVLLAGDIYDTNPLLASALFFRQQMQRLADAGVPVVAVLGNHDHAGAAPKNVKLPANVHVFAHEQPGSFSPVPGVVVHGQSYPVRECRADLAAGYPAPEPGLLNLGLLHTALGDAQHAPYAPTDAAALASRGYDYWALGHVHRFLRADHGGVPIVFPGNSQGRNVRETGAKGAVLVGFERGRVASIERRELDVVRWHHVEVDAGPLGAELAPGVAARVLEATAADRATGRPCAVRVTLRGRLAARARGARAVELREALLGELQAGADAVWLEKVRVEARVPEEDGAEVAAELGRVAALVAADPAARGELSALVDEVRTQLRRVDPRLVAADAHDAVRAEALVGDGSTMSAAEAEALLGRALAWMRPGLR